MAINPTPRRAAQGTLNRLLTQLTLSNFPSLNVSAENMTEDFMRANFSGAPTLQIQTGTGLVNSPAPYIMGSFSFSLLRTQSLASAWLEQLQNGSVLGSATGYSDSSVFNSITLDDAAITEFDPGAWNGTTPVVAVTITGIYYTNNNLWG